VISLNLGSIPSRTPRTERDISSLDDIEKDFRASFDRLNRWLRDARKATTILPAELLFQAAAILTPVERMAVAATRSIGDRAVVGTLFDVTGRSTRAYVRADARKLADALLAFERAGVQIAAWLHSHPGSGPGATMPSQIDQQQYADWTRHYGELIGIILVADGHLRLWGRAVESGDVRVEIVGAGVHRVLEHQHVYRLDV
jgi:proteasome lid subunit RPN8/RPN11